MAETVGFEPTMRVSLPYSLSRGAPSAARPRLRFSARNESFRVKCEYKYQSKSGLSSDKIDYFAINCERKSLQLSMRS